MKKKFSLFSFFLFSLLISVALHAKQISMSQVQSLISFCDSTKADEILISHKGKIITHWRRTDFNQFSSSATPATIPCGSPYMGTASMVKSWTGLLIGILIDKKIIKSVDDPVCRYLPEWKIGCKNEITIRHLLTMSAGYKRLGGRGILSKADMNAYVLKLKPDTLPNIRFNYSNESVQLLGILIEKVTSLKADKAFEKYLFKPLQIDSTTFMHDSVGNAVVYGGVTTTVRHAHTIGMLMLQNGKYKNKQIVSEQWIRNSVTPSARAPYYGFLWWLDNNSTYKNFAATGDVGQLTIVFPELELVFVRKQICDQSAASINMSWMGPSFLERIGAVVKP